MLKEHLGYNVRYEKEREWNQKTYIKKNKQYQDVTSLIIPEIYNYNGKDYKISYIPSYAFAGCESLTNVTIPNSVVEIGDRAFLNCSSLKNITIPNSVTKIGDYAFGNCSSLTNITIPNSVTKIGYYAFGYCSSLTSVTIPDSVIEIGEDAFCECPLKNLIIPDSVIKIHEYAFCNLPHIEYHGRAIGKPWYALSMN